MEQRKELDPRLEHLYMSNVRCPYCKSIINKYETSCARCGVKKEQIFNASNKRAKEILKKKTGEKIFMSRTRPSDVSFFKILVFALLGIFGAHNFYLGRKKRGWFMVSSLIISFVCSLIWPYGTAVNNYADMHQFRKYFADHMLIFPTDLLVAIVLLLWTFDVFGIVFGFYKYPVRLGELEVGK